MPRIARQISPTGFYHITMRGVGRHVLFEDDSDRRFFIDLLRRYASEQAITIIAWVLMSNHIHLLIDDPNLHISEFMHRIALVYARHFNVKSDHVGHVFENRYFSTPIITENQLINTVLYIHNNPVEARVCSRERYAWSSYGEYTGIDGLGITNTDLVLGIVGGVDSFIEISNKDGYGDTSDSSETEDHALLVAYSELGKSLMTKIGSLEPRSRNAALQRLRDRGLTVREIERVTGIGKSTIARVTTKS